ncbi:MAG: C40 family peptidase [Armatimonadetes bacterium]|nr:C40 family peptidase [Armatimonadota bacterium]
MPSRRIVIRAVTDMRVEPDIRSERISQALMGEWVEAQSERSGFLESHTEDGYTGWIWASSLAEEEAPPRLPNHYIGYPTIAQIRNAYATLWEIEHHDQPITILAMGSRVMVEFEMDRIAMVTLPDGRTGRVKRKDLAPIPETRRPNVRRVIETGMRLLGVPYLWGGVSTFGIDCSGFTQRIYRQHGILLPRDAYLQSEWVEAASVPSADLQAGDLVFFGPDQPDYRRRTITHVGMAIGSGHFIHSSGNWGVHISSLSEEYYQRRWRCSRRVRLGSGSASNSISELR